MNKHLVVGALVVLALQCLPASAEAEVFLSAESRVAWVNYAEEKSAVEEAYVDLAYGSDTLGIFASGYSTLDSSDGVYHEFVVGPYIAPVDGLELSLGYGREWFEDDGELKSAGRFAAYVSISSDLGYIDLTFENSDGSGYYYEHRALYQATDWIGVGGLWLQHLGYGPVAEFTTALGESSDVVVWAAYLSGDSEKDQPDDTVYVGLKFTKY